MRNYIYISAARLLEQDFSNKRVSKQETNIFINLYIRLQRHLHEIIATDLQDNSLLKTIAHGSTA